MPFDVKEFELDEDLDILDDFEIEAGNLYISDSKNAVKLISTLLRNEKSESAQEISAVRKEINQLFDLYADLPFDDKLTYYKRFNLLCDRLSEYHKIRKINRKTVVGLGGKFSSGKSKFINSITGMKNPLPENQSPTTSIPTYILANKTSRFIANSYYGYSCELDAEAVQALTHEFYDVYNIGFSSHIESIIVETPDFQLNSRIALLDTPGYSKSDRDKARSKQTISDAENAKKQLRIIDYLIWLVDIDNGVINEDDIAFIRNLNINTPILIVFNKADKKAESEIERIIEVGKETVSNGGIDCFGVTAYSSLECREYFDNQIENFFDMVANSGTHQNDLLHQFISLEKDMHRSIMKSKEEASNISKEVYGNIAASKQIIQLQSLAQIWSEESIKDSNFYNVSRDHEKIVQKINRQIKKIIESGETI